MWMGNRRKVGVGKRGLWRAIYPEKGLAVGKLAVEVAAGVAGRAILDLQTVDMYC